MSSSERSSHKIKIGLALGSGSARGWSHIGVIEALPENQQQVVLLRPYRPTVLNPILSVAVRLVLWWGHLMQPTKLRHLKNGCDP